MNLNYSQIHIYFIIICIVSLFFHIFNYYDNLHIQDDNYDNNCFDPLTIDYNLRSSNVHCTRDQIKKCQRLSISNGRMSYNCRCIDVPKNI